VVRHYEHPKEGQNFYREKTSRFTKMRPWGGAWRNTSI
jgi:hypothetical protein